MTTYYHANTAEVCGLLMKGQIRGKGISCWRSLSLAVGWASLHKGYIVVFVDVKDQKVKRGWTWGYMEKQNILAVY